MKVLKIDVKHTTLWSKWQTIQTTLMYDVRRPSFNFSCYSILFYSRQRNNLEPRYQNRDIVNIKASGTLHLKLLLCFEGGAHPRQE